MYVSANERLPDGQTQVLVLETAPAANGSDAKNSSVLVRGDNWNATSVGPPGQYANLIIQPVDRVCNDLRLDSLLIIGPVNRERIVKRF